MTADLTYERAAAGAKLLDAKFIGWWLPHYIDLDQLDMLSCRMCVLGQIYGLVRGVDDGYMVGYYALLGGTSTTAMEMGFLPTWTDFFLDGAYLENAWRDLILERRAEDDKIRREFAQMDTLSGV